MIVDEELERLDEPETLPQEIVEWQPTRGRLVGSPPPALNGAAVLGVVLGAAAVGAVAVGAVAIARLAIGRAHIHRLTIDELTVRRLRVLEG